MCQAGIRFLRYPSTVKSLLLSSDPSRCKAFVGNYGFRRRVSTRSRGRMSEDSDGNMPLQMIALGRQRIPQEMKGGPMRNARICGVSMNESDRQDADIAGSCEA